MTHDELVEALRSIDGLVDHGGGSPNFHFRSRPFLHFHEDDRGTYADVRLGTAGFEPIRASTADERLALLASVIDHVERLAQTRKSDRRRSQRYRTDRSRR
jgi:hypothetical protein